MLLLKIYTSLSSPNIVKKKPENNINSFICLYFFSVLSVESAKPLQKCIRNLSHSKSKTEYFAKMINV